jgi:integrase
MSKRRANGEGAIYKSKDGRWRASVELGWKDGKRQRKVLSGATKAEVAQKLRQVQGQQDDGLPISRDGRGPTVEKWLWHWLDNVQGRRVRERTLMTQTSIVQTHIVPSIGKVRLRDLLPDHIEQLEAEVAAKDVTEWTVLGVHRVLSRALTVAEQRNLVSRNVCRLVDAPVVKKQPVQPLSKEDARGLLAAAGDVRNGARWLVALGLGLRQSEALGLSWDQVDFDAGTLQVTQQLNRATYRHGCGRPATCGERPTKCSKMQGQGMSLSEPKSAAGRRTIVLPQPLVEALRTHRAEQAKERLKAGTAWWTAPKAAAGYSWDLVFRTPLGKPIQHRHDSVAWKALLAGAEVRDARLHDARHTAASLLLAMRVPARVVMEVLGHSKYELTMTTYSHVMPELARDAADQMTAALWGAAEPTPLEPRRRRRTS